MADLHSQLQLQLGFSDHVHCSWHLTSACRAMGQTDRRKQRAVRALMGVGMLRSFAVFVRLRVLRACLFGREHGPLIGQCVSAASWCLCGARAGAPALDEVSRRCICHANLYVKQARCRPTRSPFHVIALA